MKRALFLFCVLALLFSYAQAQQVKPTPPKDDDAVVKISTNLIQVDVTVTDKSGKVVSGLNPDDFEIYENGEKQTISNFTFASERSGTIEGTPAAANPGQTADISRGQVRRTIAVIVDDLNLSFASVYYTRKALRRFLDEQMQPGDLVAIIRTGGNVGALQQFTSDKQALYAAIERIRWNPLGNGGVDSIPAINQTAEDITERTTAEIDNVMRGDPNAIRIGGRRRPNLLNENAREYDGTKNFNEFQEGIFAVGSLGSMSYVIRGMQDLPGRKMMMLFSDGIRIHSDSSKSYSTAVYNYLQELVDTANRASVVVYTFDTRGLASLSPQAADTFTEIRDSKTDSKLAERFSNFNSTQDGLVFLANETGGKSLLNSNNLNYGIQRALEEQSGYYLIGYLPNSETFDPAKRKFNKLEVKLKRPDLKVSYRSGFFSTASAATPASALSVEERMANALMSPFAANDIALSVNALYANDTTDGPFIRSFLHIDAKGLTFTEDPEGWKKATFEVAAVTFGDNGAPSEKAATKYTIKTKGPTYEAMLKNGFVYVLIVPARKPGLYQYRVALRDEASGKIGSASQLVEIPDLQKQAFAVSSIGVEAVTPATWQLISQGKVGNGSGQTQVASTFLYDTVLKEFRPGTVLRYGVEVYDAKPDKSGAPQLEATVKIVQNGKILITGHTNRVDGKGVPDPKNIRISGAVMLKDDMPPGDYVLHVLVRDLISKKFATQIFPFTLSTLQE
jgi:VWFA-related protein